jgi:ribosome-binding ATPase YchF (GTP1/OBG family)
MNKSIKPENILSDDESSKIIDGIPVRKGTVGAVLANAKILASASSTEAEKQAALKVIEELAPALVVLNVYEHIQWKNPAIQQIVENAARKLNR